MYPSLLASRYRDIFNAVGVPAAADVNKRRIRRVYAQDFARNRVQIYVDLPRLDDRFFFFNDDYYGEKNTCSEVHFFKFFRPY